MSVPVFRSRWRGRVFKPLLVMIVSAPSIAQDAAYGPLTDWRGWARWRPGTRAVLASSYDRTGGNADYCWYESPPGLQYAPGVCTVRTISGPGVVRRFWMPHYTSNFQFLVRLYFDDDPVPRIDTTSDEFFAGGVSYVSSPFVTTCAGGQVSYEPLAFSTSLRIETINQVLPDQTLVRHYYQYQLELLPAGSAISTYDGTLSPSQQSSRDAAAQVLVNVGAHPDPAGSGAASAVQWTATSIPAGESLLLAGLDGPGRVRRFHVAMPGATDAELDGLRLIVTYDAEEAPGIDASIADFFGAGHDRPAWKSLPLGTDSPDGFYCYWPMPFRRSIRVELRNATAAPIAIDGAVVEHEAGALGAEECYLHAHVERRIRGAGDVYHPLLSTTGRGVYVGNLLYCEEATGGLTMLEGDDVVTVDGVDTLYGTGLEDAYNGGYYYNWTKVQYDEPDGPRPPFAIRPLFGALRVHRDSPEGFGRADQYRWYIADRIVFSQSIEVKVEDQYGAVGSSWASVAFWYAQPRLPADVNNDGLLNSGDVVRFAEVLLAQDSQPEHIARCDLNGDSMTDGADIAPFVREFGL
ncbi:MAG: DUF2961 domain-containing protein [Phycisphaerae bacterium]|nr:DUF2961 domain-containing protein [Phycisphaerae bacterium]